MTAENPIRGRKKKKHISFVKHIFSPAVFPSVVLQCDSTRLPMFGEKKESEGLASKDHNCTWEKNMQGRGCGEYFIVLFRG